MHGWSCDARYWRSQVPAFSRNHRVIVPDLAGHGHSGTSRTKYTMNAFGEDVQAVIQAAGSRRVILIGHSMGGSVIAEDERLGRKSYRLRDDDNIHLGRIETRLFEAVQEGQRRLGDPATEEKDREKLARFPALSPAKFRSWILPQIRRTAAAYLSRFSKRNKKTAP